MRFTVGKKIGFGFAVVVLIIAMVFSFAIYIVFNSQDAYKSLVSANQEYETVERPTVENLQALQDHIVGIKTYANNWVYVTENDYEPLEQLVRLLDTIIPNDTIRINEISDQWTGDKEADLLAYKQIKDDLNFALEMLRSEILEYLPDYEAKSDPTFLTMAQLTFGDNVKPELENLAEKVNVLLEKKNESSRAKKEVANQKSEDTNNQLNTLLLIIFVALGVLVVSTVVIALVTTRSITKPVQELKHILLNLGKGVFPKRSVTPSNDEIGEMSVAMNQLVSGLKGTTEFAKEVGKSNFEYPYNPLSEEDELGKALVIMRDELAESERILEQKVKDRTAEVVAQKEEIEQQNETLEELYKDITDSIRYAKRLQDSILPTDNFIDKVLPESFVLFKPKDIVSGDFYWCSETDNKVLFSAVDCTGHGVPGAFMSLIGANALNQIVNQNVHEPAEMLNQLNRLSSEALNKSEEGRDKVRDGMDLALCAISKDGTKLEYSGANNPLYIIRDGELEVVKADKFAIASFTFGEQQYKNHEFDVKKGDIIYIFSDGYADQFGGVKGKKFMYRQFRELLMSIKDKPMKEQKRILDERIEEWKGSYEQVDDILVIGVRIV